MGGECETWRNSKSWSHIPAKFSEALDQGWDERFNPDSQFSFPLTARPDVPDQRDHIFSPRLSVLPGQVLPKYWPSRKPGAQVPIRFQGVEPTCTAQALATAIDIESLQRSANDGPEAYKPASARYLHEAALLFETDMDDGLPGSSLRAALKGFWHRGACDHHIMPYLAGYANGGMTVVAARNAKSRALGEYMSVQNFALHYHAVLADGGTLLVSAMIHDGWMPHNVAKAGGVIQYSGRASDYVLRGAHAFVVVGYTETGFIVANAWGAQWGGFDLKTSSSQKKAVDLNAYPGLALWLYDDWKRNVLNAWTFRLAAPTKLPSGQAGGFVPALGMPGLAPRLPPSVREADILGHVIHVSNKILVEDGLYCSSLTGLEMTAQYIVKNNKRYKHVAFLALGIEDGYEMQLRKAQLLIPPLKAMGIYPVFVVWRTALTEALPEVLKAFAHSISARTSADHADLRMKMLQKLARPVLAPLWRDITQEMGDVGALATTMKKLTADCVAAGTLFHIVAQGAGAIPMAYCLNHKIIGKQSFKSVLLIDSHCDRTLFETAFLKSEAQIEKLRVADMGDKFQATFSKQGPELFGNFGKLLSRCLTGPASEILGDTKTLHAKVMRKFVLPVRPYQAEVPTTVDVLNAMANFILGKRSSNSLTPFDRGFTESDLHFR